MRLDPINGILALDFETASELEVNEVGAWAYAAHPSTRLLVACFVYTTGPRARRDRYTYWPGSSVPRWLIEWVQAHGTLLAFNCAFEKSIWFHKLRHLLPMPDESQWVDTQAHAAACNLPIKLEGLAKTLGCPTKKDEEGAALMREMAIARPDGVGGWHYDLDPARLERLGEYCMTDDDATLDCHFRLPTLSPTERRIWIADQKINGRGVYLDREFARKCLDLSKARAARLANEAWALTDGEIEDATKTPALKVWLKAQGVTLPKVRKKSKKTGEFYWTETADKNAVNRLLDDELLPRRVRELLEVRREANKATSLSKLRRVETMCGEDGRLRYALRYSTAHTGRWTSGGLQLHNLPKNGMSPAGRNLVELLIEKQSVEGLLFVERAPLEAVSQSLRSVIAAPPGFEIIGGDFSAVEARVVAWLAGQEDVLELFRAGIDVYVYAAKRVNSNDRQLGKVCVLALGYGMGDIKFVSTAAGAPYFVHLELKDAVRIKKAWREANSEIVSFWRDLETACMDAILTPGRTIPCRRLACYVKNNCLFVRLPSGRTLRYWRPSVVTVEKVFKVVDDDGNIIERTVVSDEIQFFTVSKDKNSMTRESTYGGKLVENATQAVARDLMGEAVARFDALEDSRPYRLVVHVHDSGASEVPAGTGSVDDFCAIMAEAPPWAVGLPIRVEGYRARRFKG